MRSIARFSSIVSPALQSPAATPSQEISTWHSPVPYLFGGLAAMLGLIAFALLILACSYWKLSGYLGRGDGDSDELASDDKLGEDAVKPSVCFVKGFVVINPGDKEPTHLATPISTRVFSSGDSCTVTAQNSSAIEGEEKVREVSSQIGDPTQTQENERSQEH